tara:strand:- start:138 stop:299 length:162 start_codon:yes stop_codon:yes gene_type:complete
MQKLIIKFLTKFLKKPQKKKSLEKFTILDKNPWLYPTDNFGKLEKGVVYNSKN